jgi:uncharacterized iron-regulated membrane protein
LRSLLVVSHRWTALILGLLVVVVSTSGALIVYEPEILRASNSELFHTTAADRPVSFSEAVDAVARMDPEFGVADVSLKDGVYLLSSADGSGQTYFVDAGTGAVNGHNNLYGGVVGFLENLHDCALTCEEYAGYVPWLAAPSAIAGFPPFSEMTWGAVLLAIAALALVILAVTAPFIWWPSFRKWRNAFRLRWRKGRFARDFDLHNVIGIVAIVPLLVWGLTGLNFEMPGFNSIWYSATGGEAPPADNYTMEPSERPGAPVSLDDAIGVAEHRFPGATVTWVGMPESDDGFYSIDLIDGGPDLWAHNAVYRGNRSVGVDALDRGHMRVFLGPSETVSNAIADEWAQPALHYGHAVNPYWRALWFVLGLAPLALLVTGLSTWLYRRQVTRRRRSGRDQPAGTKAIRTLSATGSKPICW